jgi:iron complex outermembrane receptor protein
MALQYTEGPFMAALSGKYVAKRYTTLVNDEFLDAYQTFDFDAGYRLPSSGWVKSPTIRLNVTNLFNKKYLLANSGSGGSITTTLDSTVKGGGTPSYYVGAPRFASVSLTAEF